MRQTEQDWTDSGSQTRLAVREGEGLVVPRHFIQATRDTGYRNLAYALAELVDNALDAGASKVDIRILEEKRAGERNVTIAVLDDGRGMDRDSLRHSLRFGGSERFGDRASLGRYGMGLPNSSLSQAPRVDIFTWRQGADALHAYLDVDQITQNGLTGIPEPVLTELPEWVPKSESGTLVQWSRCDRLRFKKASTLARKIRGPLGRMYRIPLQSGVVVAVNGEPIHPVDPLFRDFVQGLPGTCEPYGDPLEYRVKLASGETSVVSVHFVELPVARWHDLPTELKRETGIIGGAGMSILRRGREIDYGWHFLGSKRKENYDDWWRGELRFEPSLDELIGITHSKQGINPTPEIRAILEPDLERIARDMNSRVRRAFREARSIVAHPAATRAAKRDRLLPGLKVPTEPVRSPTAGFKFHIGFHEEPRPEFFTVRVRDAVIELEVSKQHPFYRKLYLHAQDRSSDLDILLLAAARALLDVPLEARQTLVRSWSDNLLAFLEG